MTSKTAQRFKTLLEVAAETLPGKNPLSLSTGEHRILDLLKELGLIKASKPQTLH